MFSKASGLESAITVQNVSKCYRTYAKPIDRLKQAIYPQRKYCAEYWALRDLSLTVEPGQSLGIIGRNGSGKSTLLQLICGTLTPTTGTVNVVGRVGALLELGSGFNSEFTGIDNIYLNSSILGLSRTDVDERLDSILAFADIGDFVHQPIKTYSSGMIVRLAFAVIAHIDADVLIIDEALAVGDIFFAQKCSRFMKAFREKGTLLFVSHDMESVKALCDQSLWLDKGEVQMLAPTKVVADAYFAEAYGSEAPATVAAGSHQASSATASDQSPGLDAVAPPRQHPWFDHRQKLLGDERFGSVVEISSFVEAIQNSERFGTNGEVEILGVELLDPVSGAAINHFRGGYPYSLHIVCRCAATIDQPDVGFCLNDKNGQILFGDNTNLVASRTVWTAGSVYRAIFEFDFPILRAGEYTITVAVQEHAGDNPRILSWIHDALLIYTLASSNSVGLCGAAMRDIAVICESEIAGESLTADSTNSRSHQTATATATSTASVTATATATDQQSRFDGLTSQAERRRKDLDYRIRMTTSCADAALIPKVEDAGRCVFDPESGQTVQRMHNGLNVVEGGYYGDWMRQIIETLQGHHEPQEEFVFHELLGRLGGGATMIELGSFWSYYSLWFLHAGEQQGWAGSRRAICVEADPQHLEIGRRNAEINHLSPTYINGFAAAAASDGPVPFETESSGVVSIPALTVQQLMEQHSIEFLDVLHADTQGAELDVLEGAKPMVLAGKIRFVVLSTHSYEICGDPLLHQRCLQWLLNHGAHIICEHDVHESFSGDGLIVASFHSDDRDWRLPLSRNRYSDSLFPNPAYYVPMRPRHAPLL